MIDEITIQNMRTGEKIVMDKTGNTGLVISEIDWDSASVTNESYRIPFQIGETLSNTVVGTRVPTITGYVVSNNTPILGTTWEEYYNAQKEDIENKKDNLNKFISIYDTYRIIAGDFYLEGLPRQPIKYSYDENENNEVLCLFEIELGCYDPTFKRVGGSVETFYELIDLFHLPMNPTNSEPLVFSEESLVTQKTINNLGDVSTGMIVTIIPLYNSISGFTLTNVTTGEQLKIKYTIDTDSYIVLNTRLGEEDIYIVDKETGDTQSLISVIDIDSAFIQLQRGENMFLYSINDESDGMLDISIEYTERFFNIKEL